MQLAACGTVVGGIEIAVPVQDFRCGKGKPFTGPGVQFERHITGQVLPEVDDPFSAGSTERSAGENGFLFMDFRTLLGNQHGFREIADLCRYKRKGTGHIHILAGEDAAQGYRAFGNFPGIVRQDDRLAAILETKTEGGDEHGGKEFIRIAGAGPGRIRPAEPAVGNGDLKRILFTQQACDIISLYLQAPAVFSPAGGKNKITDPAAVQHRFVYSVAGHFQDCGADMPA